MPGFPDLMNFNGLTFDDAQIGSTVQVSTSNPAPDRAKRKGISSRDSFRVSTAPARSRSSMPTIRRGATWRRAIHI